MTMKERLKLNILVIDTSSKICALAIKYNEEKIYKFLDEGRTHSETLLPLIDETLKENNISLDNIDVLGVSTGPGSFTGIRIGISTIKAISLAKDIPVIEINSTEILARNIINESMFKIGIIDAKNDQIYAGIYTNDYRLVKEFAGSIIDFIKILNEIDVNENYINENKSSKYSFSGSGIKYEPLIRENMSKKDFKLLFIEDVDQDIKRALEGIEDKLKDNNNLVDGRKIVPNYLKPSNAERKS